MVSKDVVFWDVDTQKDFMLPGGALYVQGAEKLIPNVKRLVDAVREGKVFLVSSVCAHTPDDPEFQEWPPHCIQGTPGQEKIPETLTGRSVTVANRAEAKLPERLEEYQQLILEKNTLSDFDNPHTEPLLEKLGKEREYVVFGVVTEYCVRLAAAGMLERGYRVALVRDAIETLEEKDGKKAIEELVGKGARLIKTEEALEMVGAGRSPGGKKAAKRGKG